MRSPLLQDLEPERAVAMARDVAREKEDDNECGRIDGTWPSGFRFTLLISTQYPDKEGRIISRRGYDTKYSY